MLGPVRSITGALVVATGLCAVGFSPSVARADHDSYEYLGTRHGFHGEAHLIDALRYLEQAYYAGHGAHRPIRKAREHIIDAMSDICNRRARYLLRGALDHLSDFRYLGELSELDTAARLVTKALAAERSDHVIIRPPVVRRPYYPGFGHRHPGFGHRYPGRGVKVSPYGVGVSWGRGGLVVRF